MPEDERFSEIGESIFFHKTKMVFHVSFVQRFYGCNVVSARRKIKGWFTRGQQDEIIHYLKKKATIK